MADIDNDLSDSDEDGTVMSRIKESPRTVSALIIILIVAAAIYAFSGNNETAPEGDGTTAPVAVTTTEAEATPGAETTEEVAVKTTPTPAATRTPVTQEQLNETAREFPEARKSDTGYVEVAQAGDGVTHLARRAATRWLSENQAGYAVTNEHRIYIEDYIKDQIGSQRLSLEQEQTISFDMVKEAVEAAKGLSPQQLQNLSHYTPALT